MSLVARQVVVVECYEKAGSSVTNKCVMCAPYS